MVLYGIWVHPARGSDYRMVYRSKAEAIRAMHMNKRAERVVYEFKGRGIKLKERVLSKKEMHVRKPRRRITRTSREGTIFGRAFGEW